MWRVLRLAMLLAAVMPPLMAGRVLAHAEFVTSDPPPGATLASPPAQVRVVFTQAIARTSTIAVLAPDGEVVSGPTTVSGNVATVAVRAGRPGTYRVQWANTSLEDGHERSGSFEFTVTAAAPAPAGGAGQAVPRQPGAIAPAAMPRTGAGLSADHTGSVIGWMALLTAALAPAVVRLIACTGHRR